jgi:hypothetical protein
MLWDIPPDQRDVIVAEILGHPALTFENNEQLFLRSLNSLTWYDLIHLMGKDKLYTLLKDETIDKLFPVQRRKYYHNAKRLLSKYALSTPG